MKIDIKFTHDKVRFDQANNIHLVLSVKAPKLAEEAKRPPVCVIPIIDVSGSMAGDKLEFAKKTLLKLVDHLQPGDFCALGAFATEIHEIQPPIEMTQTSKDALKNKIGELRTSTSTNFSGGLELGLRWGSKLDIGKDMLVRVIMLTDGQANHGVVGAEGLSKIVDTRGKTTVSCFGYGTDANQELLADLAKRGGGSYAFIRNPEEALTAFGKELGGLLSTYAQNIVFDLAPHNGHKIVEVLSDLDVEEKDQKVLVKLGDLLSEETRHVVISMQLSEQAQALPREMNIVDVKVAYDILEGGNRTHHQEELKAKLRFVKPGEEQEKPTPEVDAIVGMAQIGKAQVEAEDLAKRGNYSGAVGVMDAMQASLNHRGHLGLGGLAGGVSKKLGSASLYAGSQGYLRSAKGYGARGMSVSKMDGELEEEIMTSGLDAQFSVSNSMQAATSNSFDAGAHQSVVVNVPAVVQIAPVIVPTPPAAPVAAAKPVAKKVAKERSKRW